MDALENIMTRRSVRRFLDRPISDEAVETILNLFSRTRTNREYCEIIRKTRAPRK